MSFLNYNTGIPAAANNPSTDQPDMKTNTDSNNAIWDVDHYGFNDNQGGYHDVIHQPPVVGNPAAIPGIGQTFVKTVSGDQQLFFESGAGTIYNISGVPLSGGGVFALTNAFQTIITGLPANCMGYICIETALGSTTTIQYPFFSISGSFNLPNTTFYSSSNTLRWQMSGTNLQIRLFTATPYAATYKYIYWAL